MIRNKVIGGKVGVAYAADKLREAKLRWFGHVKMRCGDVSVRRCERLDVSFSGLPVLRFLLLL